MPTIIGNTVGNAIAQQQAYEAEQACLAGRPVPEKDRIKAEAGIEATLAEYFRVAAAKDQKALRQLFLVKAKDVRWSTPDGLADFGAIDDPFAGLAAQDGARTRIDLAVAGDGTTARGAWRINQVNAGGTPQAAAEYGVDFQLKGGKWRIWHLSLYKAPRAATPIVAYCHFDPADAF